MPFVRDRFTWMCYFVVGLLTFFQGVLGPIIPFLREELNLSYSEAAFHFSAIAFGAILAGISGPGLAGRVGRQRTLWIGVVGLVLEAIFLVFGATLPITVFGAFLGGIGGSYLQLALQGGLADHHGERRAYALTELNIAASLVATTAPFLVGAFSRTELTWRGALQFSWLYAGVLFLIFWRVPFPAAIRLGEGHTQTAGKLGRAFYLMIVILALTTAIEWCIIFWGSDYLERAVGLFKADAASLMSAFFFAMVVGRVIGSRLTRRVRSQTLLVAAAVIGGVGFALLWLAPAMPLNLIGLFICGLGVANYFPQGLSAALNLAPGQADRANGIITIALSASILIAPQLLGGVADSIGIKGAYGLVAGMMLAALGLTYAAYRLAPPNPA